MWNSKRKSLTAFLDTSMVFEKTSVVVQKNCKHMHWFNAFQTTFLQENYNHQLTMSAIKIINCKHKESTKFFLYATSMHNKSSTGGNLAIFKDLNIIQKGLKKTIWLSNTLMGWSQNSKLYIWYSMPRCRDRSVLQLIWASVFSTCAIASSIQLSENDLGAVLLREVINKVFHLSIGC